MLVFSKDIDLINKIIKEEGNLINFEYKNIQCFLKRNYLGSLCGYCKIPFKLKIDLVLIEVHGGITYNKYSDGYTLFGFDCNHWGDYTPFYPTFNSIYRDKEYCIQECKNMVDQILELDEPSVKIYLRNKKIEKIINI